jgi:amidase
VVDAAVKEAASKFSGLGAIVKEVSIPEHRQAPVIFDPYFIDGVQAQVWGSNVFGKGWQGYYPTRLIDFYADSRKSMANTYPDAIKTLIVLGGYMNSHYNGRFYAKAQNMVGALRDAYRKAMARIDILIMPATPRRAAPFLDTSAGLLESITSTRHLHLNTCAFNMTGHPALNVPCAEADRLPIGMQLVGRPFEEAKLLRAARAYERLGAYSVRDAATLRY